MSATDLTFPANTLLHISYLPNAETVNRSVLIGYRKLTARDFLRRTHFFGGRFENVYVERERIPEIKLILDHTLACGQEVLGRPEATLRCGFWFNDMGPGHSTTEHTHADLDELLSAVYYLEAPRRSGDLILLDSKSTTRIEPRAGMFVFFPPDLPHRVEPNGSGQQRLSLGINIGPA